MATEFDDTRDWAFFIRDSKTLRNGNGFASRWSEQTLAALRSGGLFDNMVDGTAAPAADKLWLDKNSDPAVLKEWDSIGSAWVPMTFERLFGRAVMTELTNVGGTADAITVDAPGAFIDKRIYGLVPTATNTGAATVTVGGAGTFDVVYPNGDPISAGELAENLRTPLLFTNGRFEIVFGANAGSIKRSESDPSGYHFVSSDPDLSNDTDKLALRGDVDANLVLQYAADDTALKGMDISARKAALNLANEGWWLPTTDDISAQITAADPRYLPTLDDATGAGGGFVQVGSVQTGSFFAEDGARIIRLADRLLGGGSVQSNGEAVATYVGSYMAGTAGIAADGTARLPGIGWIERNSGFAWSVGAGRIAVTGYAHSLGGAAGGTAIAASFAADNDEATNVHNVRAVYIDARRWPGVLSTTWAIEAQIANHGSTVNDSAYGADAGGGVTRGIDLYAGGDPTVQGNTNPVSSGLRFSENGGTFLKAMIFSATALYNHGGYKIAAELPSIGRIQWLANTNKDLGAFIQSDVTAAGNGMALRFANNLTTIEDLSGAIVASFQRTASAVNYPDFVSAVAGSGPALYALGSDTNIDFLLYPKGTGVLDYRKAVTVASSAPAFSALRYFPIKLAGTTHYVPCSPTTW